MSLFRLYISDTPMRTCPQGHPPTPPENSQSRPAEGSAVQRHVVASPVTTCPHPLIPGHKWAEQGQFVLGELLRNTNLVAFSV